jgi:nicotinate-nucleotide adenylyltransferase
MQKIDKKALIAIQDLVSVPPPRVALMGGSFDPPHLGHACLALSILSSGETDEIWVLPCANHPAGKPLQPLHQRVHMCELAFRHLQPQTKVLPIEKFLPTPSFTAQTLKVLMSLYPKTRFDWIIGTDLLSQLPTWMDSEWLKTQVRFLVVGRHGFTAQQVPTGFEINRFYGVEIPNLASHDLRQQIAENPHRIDGLDKAVMGYIREKELYQNKC